jgi:hypothetical protein
MARLTFASISDSIIRPILTTSLLTISAATLTIPLLQPLLRLARSPLISVRGVQPWAEPITA